MRAEAEQAAGLVEAAGRGDKDALTKLAAFKDRMTDPRFATALLEKLGPQALTTLPVHLSARVRKALDQSPEAARGMRAQNRELLSMLATALAHATTAKEGAPRLGTRFLDELNKRGREETEAPGMGGLTAPGYWALGQILGAGPQEPYSSWFMRTVGRDMIRWDRDYLKEHGVRFLPRDTDVYNLPAPADSQPFQDTDEIGAADPVGALLAAAARGREPAQALLADRDLLTYLMHDRRPQWAMGDHGESLGRAMEAAMSGQDDLSKTLAVMATQIYADDVRPHVSLDEDGKVAFADPSELDDLSGIRDNMGHILGDHADDIAAAFYKNAPRAADGELTSSNEGHYIARFGAADLDLVVLDLAADDGAYNNLLMGEIGHMRRDVDEAIMTGNETMLKNVVTNDARSLGHLMEARKQTLIARGQEADAADAKLMELVETGIGEIPIPGANLVGKVGIEAAKAAYENFVKDGYTSAGKWMLDQAGHGGGHTTRNVAEGAKNEEAIDELVRQMLESSAVAHEHYDHGKLDGRPFVVGDPPRIKPPASMNNDEYDAFLEWMERHTTIPSDFGDAQGMTRVGIGEFTNHMRKPEPPGARHE
ncbi:hypothetical protein DMB42_35815 [Nonomuraea sp. WAC 01424]|uniref:hypothetical protein n=1 Tax=Nonomuraea sp. WAC 01424 TaxID=2203200 RepID=UPI000F78BFBB|nr:hypothetical protein [Nonomuraea sp. WAC 01424]RSN02469.1 hypothetical protein DMB42_35815 [Nonomuraea sp. WAC 01424]